MNESGFCRENDNESEKNEQKKSGLVHGIWRCSEHSFFVL